MTESILGSLAGRIAAWQLRPSRGGVFEVHLDDRLVFSKKQLNRFPTTEEILSAFPSA